MNVIFIMSTAATVVETTINSQSVENSDDFSKEIVNQFKVKAIVSFEVELLVEAEDEDEAEEFVDNELIHCDLSTDTDLRVVSDFASVDVRRIEEVIEQFKVKATVSFEVELLVEAEDEDDAEDFVNSELIHCDLSTNTDLRVDNYFAHVDVSRIEEV